VCYAISTFPIRYTSAELTGHCVVLSARECRRQTPPQTSEICSFDEALGARFLPAYATMLSSRRSNGRTINQLALEAAPRNRISEQEEILQWIRSLPSEQVTFGKLMRQFLGIRGRARRSAPLWIGAHNPLDEAAFVFCEPELIRDGLTEIDKLFTLGCGQWARKTWQAYVLIAAIHPLQDCNGRLGRCLMVLIAYFLSGSWNLGCIFAAQCLARLQVLNVAGFSRLPPEEQERVYQEVDRIWIASLEAASLLSHRVRKIGVGGDPICRKVSMMLRQAGRVNVKKVAAESRISEARAVGIIINNTLNPLDNHGDYIDVGTF